MRRWLLGIATCVACSATPAARDAAIIDDAPIDAPIDAPLPLDAPEPVDLELALDREPADGPDPILVDVRVVRRPGPSSISCTAFAPPRGSMRGSAGRVANESSFVALLRLLLKCNEFTAIARRDPTVNVGNLRGNRLAENIA